jgi:DNA-binding CsgD family transcriptional regulator/N-acetylneuraminic acid mutarotase
MVIEIDLTERELEILRQLATGASNKQIAQTLNISPNTVKVHLRNIFEKIGVLSRTEAVMYALHAGLLPAEGSGSEKAAEIMPGTPADDPTGPPASKKAPLAIFGRVWPSAAGVLLVIAILLAWQLLGGASTTKPSTPAPPDLPARWQAEPRLPAPRAAMAAVVYAGQLYLFGGVAPQPEGVTASVLRLSPGNPDSPDSAAWEERAPMPAALDYIQAALIGEKIYVPGGCNATGAPSEDLEIYDPRLDLWEAGPPLPQAECGYALAAMEGHLYLFGGWDGKTALAGTWIFDPLGEHWSKGSPMPAPASYAAAQAVEGRIFVTGGYDGAHALAANRAYYPSRDQAGETAWEEKAPLPDGQYGMGSASLAGAIYLAGGVGEKSAVITPLEYLPGSDRWAPLEAPPETSGAFPALLALDTRLHLLGGKSSASHQSYQAIYTILFPVVR